MEDSFFIKVNGIVYEIVPEEGNTFTIFKNDSEYTQVLRNKNKKWMRIDYKTDEPILEENKEVEDIGRLIDRALGRD
ncbi:hypothetical protein FA048_03595 [Pedobacter polaris]|uniref:Uncharacterized protein n=1 Tax=Pedobacter polaris TaxID=2571273 RepID=A0A4U1CWM9_9SPHI|nr:hypothetical protein [Pedobacter polaris]TKC12715.1 hypothetical protein FA048_03595 [Pedobacter polaris]